MNMKFLIMETDLNQSILASYFKHLGFFILSDEKKMNLLLPLTFLSEEAKKRKIAARSLEGFAKSMLLGARPKLDVFIGKNETVGIFAQGCQPGHDLKELVSFYGGIND